MGTDPQSAFAPFIDSTERFTAAARRYVEESTKAPASDKTATDAARNFSDFLREQSIDFLRLPWNSHFGPTGAPAAPQAPMFDMPALGPTREHQQRMQRTAEALRCITEAHRRLQRLWSDALREAAAAFAARLSAPGSFKVGAETFGAAMPGTAVRRLYDSWIDCAEEAYARVAHSDSFCDALADFVNASSRWRTEVQGTIEHWAKSFDLPTRNELDTLAARLKAVEAEVGRARTASADAPRARTTPATARKARTAPRARKR